MIAMQWSSHLQQSSIQNWYFEYDMSDQPEGDYTFEFRAFDGVTESQISTRTIKLNTEPPTIWVDGPAAGSQIDDGIVHFEGRASDAYTGIFGSDISAFGLRLKVQTITTICLISQAVLLGLPIGRSATCLRELTV